MTLNETEVSWCLHWQTASPSRPRSRSVVRFQLHEDAEAIRIRPAGDARPPFQLGFGLH
jgi:hypothetical protein